MTKARTNIATANARGHTLIELMIAILVGMFLVLGAFGVMAAFEGQKRSTTAVNDALQSGNYALYTIDKLIRSSGSGLARYAASAGWGCGLNYTSAGGTTVNSTGLPSLAAPFDTVLSGASVTALRLAPVVIFPNAAVVEGSPTGSDALMLMQGGAGFGETPIPITDKNGPLVASTVGFDVDEWVLVTTPGIGNCMITKVNSSYTGSAVNNVVLPLDNSSIGSAVGLIDINNLVIPMGDKQAASLMMFGVGSVATTAQAHTLWSLDLLNSTTSLSTATQAVSDDIVMMRAVYQVQPKSTDPLTWTNPVANVTIGGTVYDYSPAGLLAGTTAASDALKSIHAIRVALIVRAPLQERDTASGQAVSATNAVNKGTYPIFKDQTAVTVTWTVPASGQDYRYREMEASIPLRNGLLN